MLVEKSDATPIIIHYETLECVALYVRDSVRIELLFEGRSDRRYRKRPAH